MPRFEALEDRALPSTLTVLNNHDSGPGSLRAVLASSSNGDTIVFAPSVHNITLTSAELSITDSVTINGPGANQLSVSGNNAYRVFEVAAGLNVTISGLAITNGYAPDQGVGILNDGSNLTLSGDNLTRNVAFESATAAADGGALRSLGGTLTIGGCQIIGNQALGAAGPSAGGQAYGGGIEIDAGSATLVNSTVSGNVAQSGVNSSVGFADGGAIFTSTKAVITDCTITNNQAQAGAGSPNGAYGGALDVYVAAPVTIDSSTISGNQAVGGNGGSGAYVGNAEGGAINNYGTLTISDSTFDHNQSLAGSGGNSGAGAFETFEDYAFGGAIATTEASLSATNTTFSHNQAIGGSNSTAVGAEFAAVGGAEGGALYDELGSTTTLTACGSGAGAGIANYDGGTVTVSGGDLDHNQASAGHHNTAGGSGVVFAGLGAGGAIFNFLGGYNSAGYGAANASTVAVSDCLIDLNQAQGVNGGAAEGGGIANVFDAQTTVASSILILNQANGGGGAALGGGAYNDATSSLALTKALLTLNNANGSPGIGGGVFADPAGTFTYDALTVISGNHASTSGNDIGS